MSDSTPYPDTKSTAAELNDDVGLAPADAYDPLIEAFKKDVDRTLLRENLKLTVDQRARKMQSAIRFADGIRGIAWRQETKPRNPNM